MLSCLQDAADWAGVTLEQAAANLAVTVALTTADAVDAFADALSKAGPKDQRGRFAEHGRRGGPSRRQLRSVAEYHEAQARLAENRGPEGEAAAAHHRAKAEEWHAKADAFGLQKEQERGADGRFGSGGGDGGGKGEDNARAASRSAFEASTKAQDASAVAGRQETAATERSARGAHEKAEMAHRDAASQWRNVGGGKGDARATAHEAAAQGHWEDKLLHQERYETMR